MAVRERVPAGMRVAMLAVLGIVLCAAPLFVAVSDVGEPVQRYDSTEVTANDTSIWTDDVTVLYNRPLSEEIACLGDYNVRTCQFEEYALQRGGIETGVRVSGPDASLTSVVEEDPVVRYVQIDGRLYERTYPTYETESEYAVRFEHEPGNAERVLDTVAVEADDVSPTVAEAIREGEATSRDEIDVPETPIATSDGSYYRVYHRNQSPAPRTDDWVTWLAALSPLGGLALLVRLWRRTEISVEFD